MNNWQKHALHHLYFLLTLSFPSTLHLRSCHILSSAALHRIHHNFQHPYRDKSLPFENLYSSRISPSKVRAVSARGSTWVQRSAAGRHSSACVWQDLQTRHPSSRLSTRKLPKKLVHQKLMFYYQSLHRFVVRRCLNYESDGHKGR